MSQEDIWTCVLTHESQPNKPTKSLFVASSHRQWGGSFTHSTTHTVLGRACNMHICVLGSDLMWWQHILLSNSWPSRCPSCDQPLLPCFLLHFAHFVLQVEWWSKINESALKTKLFKTTFRDCFIKSERSTIRICHALVVKIRGSWVVKNYYPIPKTKELANALDFSDENDI